jgi:hypothetical protein
LGTAEGMRKDTFIKETPVSPVVVGIYISREKKNQGRNLNLQEIKLFFVPKATIIGS